MSSPINTHIGHGETPEFDAAWPFQIKIGDDVTVTVSGESPQVSDWFRRTAALCEAAADEMDRQHKQAGADLEATRAEIAELRHRGAPHKYEHLNPDYPRLDEVTRTVVWGTRDDPDRVPTVAHRRGRAGSNRAHRGRAVERGPP